ncbi:hypothetical protein VTK73DRAFT_1592 [Phialemonium thermophilum]|uniref:Endosomal spry domain-containing protein n=1 Tax=Phialemonium thermophilum TaxID=223376 RepID=A0ABR3Y421_9PEZI
MAPAIIRTIFTSAVHDLNRRHDDIAALGPLAARSLLLARDDNAGKDGQPEPDPSKGVIDPHDINNTGMFVLFGLIGAAFVITGIWFFFWAKNGGFYFKKTDWDDYKSTVLRRKGPNGTTLSGATESTDLGGGSIYKDIDDNSTEDAATTVVSGSTNLTGITGGVSDFAGREKRRKKREQKEREKERRREEKAREREERKRGKTSGRRVGADGVLIDEQAEAEAEEQLRHYRHEKPARVGGINKTSDASTWDGSNPSHSGVGTSTSAGMRSEAAYTAETVDTRDTEEGDDVTSELMSNRQHTPTSTPTKKTGASGGGIRKVYSTADRTAGREAERIRAEARRLQEKGRAAASRRDFSWQRADSAGLRRIEEGSSVVSGGSGGGSSSRGAGEEGSGHVPGSWTESEVGTGSELGTKVYRHSVHIPGTSSSDFAYAEEKRKRRNGAGHRRARE